MSRVPARRAPSYRPSAISSGETLSDHISSAIDELMQLQPIASGWRTQNQTVDLIDDINRVGKRLARVGRG